MGSNVNYAAVVQSLNVVQHVALGLTIGVAGLMKNRLVLSGVSCIVWYVVAFAVDIVELICDVVYTGRREGGNSALALTRWQSMHRLVFLHFISDFFVGLLLLFHVYSEADKSLPLQVLRWPPVAIIATIAYVFLELLAFFDCGVAYLTGGASGDALQKTAATSSRFAGRYSSSHI